MPDTVNAFVAIAEFLAQLTALLPCRGEARVVMRHLDVDGHRPAVMLLQLEWEQGGGRRGVERPIARELFAAPGREGELLRELEHVREYVRAEISRPSVPPSVACPYCNPEHLDPECSYCSGTGRWTPATTRGDQSHG